jgi:hypothetical protein
MKGDHRYVKEYKVLYMVAFEANWFDTPSTTPSTVYGLDGKIVLMTK